MAHLKYMLFFCFFSFFCNLETILATGLCSFILYTIQHSELEKRILKRLKRECLQSHRRQYSRTIQNRVYRIIL